jgi:hypothetical protein
MSGGKLRIASGGSAQVEIKTKYYALRIISTFLQILAYIVGAVGIILSIFGSSRFPVAGTLGPLLFAIIGLFISVIAFIVLLAQAEIIKLFIDVEANTRAIEINTRPKNT